jgi:hypothetical protein
MRRLSYPDEPRVRRKLEDTHTPSDQLNRSPYFALKRGPCRHQAFSSLCQRIARAAWCGASFAASRPTGEFKFVSQATQLLAALCHSLRPREPAAERLTFLNARTRRGEPPSADDQSVNHENYNCSNHGDEQTP